MAFASDTPLYVRNLFSFAAANPNRVQIVEEYAGSGLKSLYGERYSVATDSTYMYTQPALDRMAKEVEFEEQKNTEESNSSVEDIE
jgi:hypothetical protein